jgi:hypothetical protein
VTLAINHDNLVTRNIFAPFYVNHPSIDPSSATTTQRLSGPYDQYNQGYQQYPPQGQYPPQQQGYEQAGYQQGYPPPQQQQQGHGYYDQQQQGYQQQGYDQQYGAPAHGGFQHGQQVAPYDQQQQG